MSAAAQPRISPAQYLDWERAAKYRSEFINGQIYAMAGASREHNLIAGNVFRELSAQLRGRPCEAYISDMRVKVAATDAYVYPDVVVVCGEPQFEDAAVDTLINPTLIIEVLSPSTEGFDRGAKFAHYRRIPSVAEYVLIAQDRVSVSRFVRQGEQWLFTEANERDATMFLDSVNCRLALSDVYERVTFPYSEDTDAATASTPADF